MKREHNNKMQHEGSANANKHDIKRVRHEKSKT